MQLQKIPSIDLYSGKTMSELNNLFNQFYLSRMELNKLKLSAHELFRFVPDFNLDWGIGNKAFFNDFHTRAIKSVILPGLSDYSRSINKRLFQNDKVVEVLFDTFMLKKKLEIQDLLSIHYLTIENGGKFRKVPAKSARGHTPIAPPISNAIDVPDDIVELLGWYNKEIENNATHPLFLSSIFHYRLVKIHPFPDGNGRLARVISSLILLSFNIPPPICKREDRQAYITCLRDADSQNYNQPLSFIGNKVIMSMRHILSLKNIANA
jgi:hypothetical protein